MCEEAICDAADWNDISYETTALYDIEPLGKGGEFIESATSYVTRLAVAHQVKVSDLLIRLIFPAANKKCMVQRYASNTFEVAYRMNGMSDLSATMSNTIQKLTGRTDIVDLSIFKLREIFSRVNSIRKNLVWCPNCIEGMRGSGGDIYYPLIWSISPVEICPIHKRPLESKCQHCDSDITILGRHQVNGFCPRCRKWLGSARKRSIKKCTHQYRVQEWKADEVSKMLINMQNKRLVDRCCMKRNLDAIYKTTTCEKRGISNTHLMCHWRKPGSLPQLETILKLGFDGGFSVNDLCFTDMDDHIISEVFNKKTLYPEKESIRRNNYDNKHLIFCTLNYYLSERYDGPPPSIQQIAKKIGFSPTTIQQYWPELATEVGVKYWANVQENKKARVELICREVNRVYWDLLESGNEPTLERVKKQLPRNYFCHDGVGYKAWQTERDKRNMVLFLPNSN